MKAVIVGAFVVAAGAVTYMAVRGKGGEARPDAVPAGKQVEITLEFSTEKQRWIETEVQRFEAANPDVHVSLVAKGSLEAASAILDGRDKPTLWSPADSTVANLVAADWLTKNPGRALWSDKPEPLLLSPLVFVVWEDRAKALGGGAHLTWKQIHAAVASPKGWPGVGGKPEWGFVKLGHTDPTRSNSGLGALVLMAYEYFGTTQPLTVEQMLDPGFQAFVKETEAGVPHFEDSTGTFMTDMVRFGPSKFDIAVVYESLAVSELANAQGRWDSLHVYYPEVTVWSDHPIVVLDGAWVSEPQAAAGRRLEKFLEASAAQTDALAFGFRPADPSVPLKAEGSPFADGRFGLSLEVPAAAPAPDAAVAKNLTMMWSRVVARRP